MLRLVLHHRMFFHLLSQINSKLMNAILYHVPVLGSAEPASSFPEIPNNFPPEEFVELVILNNSDIR